MSVSSAMNAGVMGLNVHSSKLATISDNIANSETKGYKRRTVEFSSLVLTERPTSYDAGGVRAATVKHIDAQGALVSTRNNMDLAISGRGFLPVTDIAAIKRGEPDLPQMLIRTGSFRPDESGIMRTTSGYALMGWKPVEGSFDNSVSRESAVDLVPVNISDVSLAAEPTTRMALGANLDARLTGPGVEPPPRPYSVRVEYFDILGGAETVEFKFIPSETDVNRWELQVLVPGQNAPAGAYQLAFANDTTGGANPTVAGYLSGVTALNETNLVNANGDPLYLDPTGDPAGTTSPTNAPAFQAGVPVFFDGTDFVNAGPGTTLDFLLNGVEFNLDGDGMPVDGADNPVTVPGHDRAFVAPDGSLTTTGVNAPWTETIAGVGGWNAETGEIRVTLPDGITRDVAIGRVGEAGFLSQFKAQSAPSNITKNGSPVSDIVGIEISEAGVMDAIFGSGFRKSIYKIPVGHVQNPNGLNALDGQVYTLSRDSGSIYYYDAGGGPTGRLISSALEESTTDIAEELTQLIKTQRAYSSNAKIIQTVDEMLQETTNLKR